MLQPQHLVLFDVDGTLTEARKPIQKSNIYKYKHFKDYFDFN